MSNRISSFIKRMRVNGGTIYCFNSASSDIGLNINERNNIVKISHFALLNIPNIAESSTGYKNNTFNVRNINGAWEYEQEAGFIKDGRVLIAESFQNYALNLESNLLAQDTYNPQLNTTVSERVFWKWLKETGVVRWNDPSTASNGITYWNEEIESNNYSSVVKYVGQISAGNVRIDSFGTYNETYILVPTSHGQTRAYFKQVEDDNYHHGIEIGDLGENILGRESYTKPHPDGLSYKAYYDFVDSSTHVGSTPYYTYYDNSTGSYTAGWWYNAEGFNPTSTDNAYLTDSSNYLTTGIYNVDLKYQNGNVISFRRSKLDCVSLELDLNNLKTIYGDSALTYDKTAIDYQVNDAFMFNTVLIYYSIYNSTLDTVLATNLLGVMFLDAPSGNSSEIGSGLQGILLPSLEKIASGATGFGTSYSLRLNIKTDNMLDDTQATIIDESTSDQLWGEEWQTAFQNLGVAVNTLTQQNTTFNYISGQYVILRDNQTEILNRLISLEYTVGDIGRDIMGTPGTIALFSDGDDPLIDSSIYMKYGKIGMFTNDPKYAVHIDGSVKTLDLIIENAIRDVSNNILLGYGSPLQLGSSTNYREVDIYAGQLNSALHIDTSNNVRFSNDVSILGKLQVDSSVIFRSSVRFDSSIYSPYFDFSKIYIATTNIGSGLNWDGTYLNTIPSGDVSASGLYGDVQIASVGGSLTSDPSSRLKWDVVNGRLGIGISSPSYTTHIVGAFNVDGSILRNGVELSLTTAGSNTQIQFNNSGAFGASPNLTWNGSTLGIIGLLYLDGSITFVNTNNRTISIASTTSQRTLAIHSNDQSSTIGNGGILYLRGGISGSSGGTGGTVNIYGGDGNTSAVGGTINLNGGDGGTGGVVNISGGFSYTGNGGNLYLYGGGSNSYAAGNIFIEPKYGNYAGGIFINGGSGGFTDGSISIGLQRTSYVSINGLDLRIPSIPSGTGTQFLYVDLADSNKIKTATITKPTVSWYGGVGSNNNIITGNGDGSIVSESTLQYSPYTLSTTAGNPLTIYAGDNNSGLTGGSLYLYAGDASTTAGNVYVKSGDITSIGGNAGNIYLTTGNTNNGYGGNIYLYSGTGNYGYGNLFLANNGSTDTGRSIFSSGTAAAPGISYRAQLGTGFYYSTDQINVAMSGSTRFRFTSTGIFYAYNDIVSYYTSLSDIRLKDNIKLIGPSLNKITKLQGIEYDKKTDGEHHVGFIAQDVEKIIPEVVHEVETLEAEGKYKSIRYDEIIPYLVESIKEQQKMINELKDEIIKLKNK